MRIGLCLMSLLACLVLAAPPAHACTNILVSKGASADGSTHITYAADSHTLYGFLSQHPAGEYAPGTMLDIYEWDTGKYQGAIKQAPQTYAVVGNMNQFQVSVSETTFGGRPELRDPISTVDYGSLMFLALQRAKTARQAVTVMTQLAEEYGYSSDGETFSISDPNEVWIMEMMGMGPGGKGAVWVARKVPDGFISVHANQSRIRQFPLNDPANCLYSKNVISFARDKGFFKGKDEEFSFVDAYAPVSFETLRVCEARVWNVFRRAAPSQKFSIDYVKGVDGAKPLPLWIKPDRKLSVHEVMELMRDHFENTEFDLTNGVGAGPFHLPYRWRPLVWELDGVKYLNERSISTQQTGFSFVTQSRSFLPDVIGGVLWFGVDDTYSTVYLPIYSNIRKVPFNLALGTGSFQQFSWDSAFWVFNLVANLAYTRYSDMIKDVQKAQRELEGEFLAKQKEVEQAALKLYQQSPELARDYLTKYSTSQVELTMDRWRKLWELLVVKYIDGNVKDELGQVTHPPYPDDWYRRIVAENGEHFRMKKVKGELDTDKQVTVNGYFHSIEELGASTFAEAKQFPFDKEKLLLLPGSDRCNQPVRCCLTPKLDASTGKLGVTLPKSEPNKCGTPNWLIRVPKDEKRPIFDKTESH